MKYSLVLIILLAFWAGCETKQVNLYQLDEVAVEAEAGNKENVKDASQFISIAYQDVFERPIPSSDLNAWMLAWESVGDHHIMADRIARNFLNQPNLGLARRSQLMRNPEGFIRDAYQKFLQRQPTEMEVWYLVDLIKKNEAIDGEHIYYSLLVSEEYRRY